MSKMIVNIVLFQIGWFACVLGAAYNHPLIGSGIAVLIISYHVFTSAQWQKESLLIVIVMLIGLVWDSFLVYQNWLGYSAGQILSGIAPYWIVIMWGLFATTLNMSLAWLQKRRFYSIMFGFIGGPLAYLAGGNLGALEFINLQSGLIALAIGWGVLTPCLLYISRYLIEATGNIQRKIPCKG